MALRGTCLSITHTSCSGPALRWSEGERGQEGPCYLGLMPAGGGGQVEGAEGSQPGPQTLDPWSWENRCLRALVGAGEMVVLVVASGKFCTLLFSVRSEKQGPQASAWMRKGVEAA